MESFRSVDTPCLWIAASFPGGIETGGYYSRAAVQAMNPGERHHFSCGVFLPGKTTHLEKYATEFPFVFQDDVGDDVAKPPPPGATSIYGTKIDSDEFLFMPPSWIMETSAHNYQYGYQIKPAMTPFQARLLNKALKLDKRFAASAKDLSVIQYARLPTGVNSKPGKGNFPTRLVSRDPDVTYTFDEFVKGFHLDLDAALLALSPKKAVASAETCSVETMKAILDAMPNTFSRGDWIGVCHAIQNTLGEEGRDLWVDWSETWRDARGFTPGEAERVWDTLPADHTNDLGSLRKILIGIHGETSDVFKTLQQRIADEQAPFTVIDPTSIPVSPAAAVSPDERKEEAAKKRLAALLKEARRLAAVPAQHDKEEDENWLGKDGKPADIFASIKTRQTERPIIFTPHIRGQMTMLAAPPSKGKSLLALAQGMAVVYDDQRLLRDGSDRLRFAGDVFYFCNEDAHEVLSLRAQGFIKHHHLENVTPKHGFFPVRSLLLSRDGETTTIECLRVVEAMVEHLRSGRSISMIVIDTMPASLVGVEENSTKEMNEVMKLMNRLAHAFWCDVTVIHHSVKASWDKPEEGRSLANLLRGSGASGGNVRTAVGLLDPIPAEISDLNNGLAGPLKIGRKIVAEHVVKANDGRQAYTICFHEIITVMIDAIDATDPTGTKTVQVEVPVLIPFSKPSVASAFAPAGMTPGQEQDILGRLKAHPRPVRRIGLGTKGPSERNADAMHNVLGLPNDAAWPIIDELIRRKKVEIKDGWVGGNKCEIVSVLGGDSDEEGPF